MKEPTRERLLVGGIVTATVAWVVVLLLAIIGCDHDRHGQIAVPRLVVSPDPTPCPHGRPPKPTNGCDGRDSCAGEEEERPCH